MVRTLDSKTLARLLKKSIQEQSKRPPRTLSAEEIDTCERISLGHNIFYSREAPTPAHIRERYAHCRYRG